MFKNYFCLFFSLFVFNLPVIFSAGMDALFPGNNGEITLTVLTQICDHLTGPIALKVYIEGGTPGYTLYAGGLVVGQLSVNEFVILGLHGSEGVEVTVTDALGNMADFWAEPILMPTPGADAGPEKVISCIDSVAVLNGHSETENVRFYWSGPDPEFEVNSPNPGVDVPGTYQLSVVSMKNGCRSYDSTVVFSPEYPEFDVMVRPKECFGDSSGMISFVSVNQGNPPYSYSITGGSSFHSDPIFDELPAGEYELVLQDRLGCRAYTTAEIIEPDPWALEIESPLVLPYGEPTLVQLVTTLDENDISSISWTPEEGLSCYDCLTPIVRPENSVGYQLMVVDTWGCSRIDSLYITVIKEKDIYVPNVFTPNGDHLNDVFYIKGAEGVESIKSLEIFNRWGNKVFEVKNIPPNDPQYGWDGNQKGQLTTPGVFIFIATLALEHGVEVILSGDHTLIR